MRQYLQRIIMMLQKRLAQVEGFLEKQIEINKLLSSRIFRLEQCQYSPGGLHPPAQPLPRPPYIAPRPSDPTMHCIQMASNKLTTVDNHLDDAPSLSQNHDSQLSDNQQVPHPPARAVSDRNSIHKPRRATQPYVGKRKLCMGDKKRGD